ncbi:MAG: aspartate aminotransferase family protein [Oscillospiraceae bacterium]|jgi:acetylornithine/N-succinyldiaminopimelate aminotransferase|nr:aspartate aminotransferase family protein [Oscillospiraceae bacterium]
MTNKDIIAMGDEAVMPTYGRFQVAFEKGQGATLYDFDGKAYIDFASGIGVNSLGYGYQPWVDAVSKQAATLQHVSNLYYTGPMAQVAKTLTARTGMANVFFANGGGESNEGMIKLARKYSFDKYGQGRSTIVTLRQSFHGRTISTLAATGQDVFHNYFFPFTEGFKYAVANDLDSVKTACTGDVCAVMMELIQGEGGVLPLDKDFVQSVAAFCAERDLLLLIDEVQTGVGRTGSLFCFQQYGIRPDVVSFAKGIAGGLPFGGIMANEKCKSVLGPGTHATTFGGNPVAAAGACVVLDTLDDAFLASVNEKGAYIRRKVEEMRLPVVQSVRGMGLMVGIGVTCSHKDAVGKMLQSGLLALTAGSDTVRLLPPLNISYEEIDAGLAVLKTVLEGMT